MIKKIDLSYARLLQLPRSWTNNHLTVLCLDGNRVESPEDLFNSKNVSLSNLRLSENKKNYLSPLPYLPSVVSLSIVDSVLSAEIPNMCWPMLFPNIKHLVLRENNILEFRIPDDKCNLSDSTTSSRSSTLINLHLDENRIASFSFLRRIPSLRLLNMAHNDIQEMDWQSSDQHGNIAAINLSYNRLVVLDKFTCMSALGMLVLSHNQIRVVVPGAFKGSFNIWYLNLDGNQLTEVPDLSMLSQISFLDLSFNRLKVLNERDVRNLTVLLRLTLQSNEISNISLPPNLALHRLYLQNNALKSVEDISAISFDVGGNRISDICSLGLFERVSFNNNKLSNLRLPWTTRQIIGSHNRIKTLTVNYCPTNDTQSNDGLQNTPCNLFHISLPWNDISYVGPESMKGCFITYLNLEGNPILSLFVDHFPGLMVLFLSHTNVHNVTLVASKNTSVTLQRISMVNVTLRSLNLLTNLSFLEDSLLSVTDLVLTENRMDYIPVLTAPFIRNLNLSLNIIRSIPREAFSHISMIRVIDLSKNLIKNIPSFAFFTTIHVQEINLENNRIDSIEQSAFPNQSHFTLRLGNNNLMSLLPSSRLPLLSRNIYFDPNPWRCDCEEMPLVEWLQRSGVQRVYCWSPMIFRNRSAVSLYHSDVCPKNRVTETSPTNGICKHFLLNSTERQWFLHLTWILYISFLS
ncbi:leucine-rich repeat-containing protein 15-like [Lytechinus variegatus]|uniref:leucine-rich repeat-containing protein 15-like n=1 Tax=Lytechinus variegatus TaxID=7654 RepID=UPI001BB2B5B1|nr:leucine-rich repeat-containing protein 15-like [Lytechinus variegatus]